MDVSRSKPSLRGGTLRGSDSCIAETSRSGANCFFTSSRACKSPSSATELKKMILEQEFVIALTPNTQGCIGNVRQFAPIDASHTVYAA